MTLNIVARAGGFVGLLLLVLGWADPRASEATEVFLGVSKAEASRIPLGVLYVVVPKDPVQHSSEIRSILENDLRRSQVFRVVHPPLYSELVSGAPPTTELIRRAGQQDLQAAVWISLTQQGGTLILEARVYDAKTGQTIMGKRYTAESAVLRTVIHRFADDIIYQYTGERGVSETRVVYSSLLTGSKELYLMDYDGYNVRKITSDRSLSLSPKWSPDGSGIVYTSYRSGFPAIYTLDMATGRLIKMIGFPGLNISPAWSPSGNALAFASSVEGPTQLYRVGRDGKGLQKLTMTQSDDLSPAWSPSGAEIAFTSNRGGGPQIYIMNADGTNVRRLTFRGDYNTSPAWSPKGDAVAYTCRVDGRLRICAMSPDGRNLAQLTAGLGEDESPTWSRDGKHLIFSSTRSSAGDLYMMNADGTEMERLTFNGAKNNSPAWSP